MDSGLLADARPRNDALTPLSNVDEMAGNTGRRRHDRRHQMGAALVALTALEIAV